MASTPYYDAFCHAKGEFVNRPSASARRTALEAYEAFLREEMPSLTARDRVQLYEEFAGQTETALRAAVGAREDAA